MAGIDTLVVFYHPAQPGLHKRLRAEYKHGHVYVEASHPAAALLDEEQTGWTIAALAVAPVTKTVYYWEETLREARTPRDVYNNAPTAYAKRLDLYIPHRLLKTTEVAVIPTTGEEAGWRYRAQPATTLLHTLYHLYTWATSLETRKGHIRLYTDTSLAPPREATILAKATRLLAYTLAAQGHTVEYAVYAAPTPPRAARRTPLVELERIDEDLIEGPRDALKKATLELLATPPAGQPIRTLTPRTPTPREQARRLERAARRATAIAALTLTAAIWAAAAIAKREKNPLHTTTRILTELVQTDLSTATLQKYQEGGLLAHNTAPNPRHLTALALLPPLTTPLHATPEPTPDTLPRLAAQAPLPTSKPASLLAEKLAEHRAWIPSKPAEETCNPANTEEALRRLLIHPATLEEHNGELRVKTECAEETGYRAAKST